ncbi:FadR/GntR family transcriptional regulator [Gracilibacillus kekensis]|uniref:Transcriptional regulator, GntR family n=1 Tax=Gracilibacillus kekensis TaxID=1027249 RepID=A0A1M7Q8I1_9BACI|nr:FadR/GntR family transcriptional regulator [Gracilibacillus kekensis]SHN26833.1 transcriptional regulator, GntR family [Gracilibacillus kekensis]
MEKGQFEFKPIQKNPLVVELTRRLLDYIFSGSIQPGDRLPAERQLQEALGVGRSAIREAIKVLTVLGILEVKQGDGTYLKTADSGLLLESIEWGLLLGENRVHDIIEVRKEIEAPIARLAAERCTDTELKELRLILDKLKVSTIDDFVELDIAFHIKIAQMSKNTVFIGILSSIQSLLRTWIKLVIEEVGETQFSYNDHYNIYQALSNKDPQASVEAMELHLDDATGRILNIIKAKNEIDA